MPVLTARLDDADATLSTVGGNGLNPVLEVLR